MYQLKCLVIKTIIRTHEKIKSYKCYLLITHTLKNWRKDTKELTIIMYYGEKNLVL